MAKVELVATEMPVLLPMMGRSPGIHISEIIHELCVRLGKYAPSEQFNQSQLELGNAFEWAIIARMQRQHPHRYVDIGELTVDDIHGTPDQGDVEEEAIDEVKCTWMSSNHGPGSDMFWKYEQQIKSYCYMVGWSRAYLNVLFVNGDYAWRKKDATVTMAELGPSHFRRYRYDFSQSELEQHWRVMLMHAAGMRAQRELGE